MKIANKISLSFIITGVMLVGIIAPIYYKIAKDNMEKTIFAHLITTAESRARHIETLLKEDKYKIRLISESDVIEAGVKVSMKNDPNSRALVEKMKSQLNEFVEKGEEINEIFILSLDGKIAFSSDEKKLGLDKSSDISFLEGKDKVYIKDIHYFETMEEKGYAISAPIRDDDTKELLGVFVARFNLDGFNEIAADRVGLGETGEIYFVNKQGYMITPSRFTKEDFVLKQKVDTLNVRNCLAHKGEPHLSLKEEITVFPDYRGVTVLGTHEYIEEMQWALVAEIDVREALAPLNKIRLLFVGVLFSVPIVVWLIAVVISKVITGPIRSLHKGTEIIGEGNLDYRVGTDAKDEIGQLSRAFDRMAENLEKTTTSIDDLNKEIAERKKAEENLKIYSRELKKSNKELDDFTYIVSHDLKEPLRSIDAFSKFISDDYKDKLGEEGKDYLGRVRINASRMQKLIEDLLEISRIGRKESSFGEVKVEEIVNEVKLRLEYAIKENNAEIIVRDKLPKIFCDRVRLTEVFVNLVSNAIKFNDKPNPRIEIGCTLKGALYEFYVRDNGPGIDKQYFDKIFEIFQRLGKREEAEGTGAGLTIVKKIIQLHNGKIWLESKKGEGATFYFTIPKEKEFILGRKKIGEILVEKKLVTEEDVKKALEEQEKGE